MKVLDLFSGLGGFSLGLERIGKYRTIAFCEMDKYCKLVLQKHWKGVKIYNDVKEITKERFEADGIEFPEIITGGFPCQPFSVAGKQKGTSDDRHLWPEMFRIIKEFKPRWVIGENVPGIINIQDGMVFETVCTNLESEGYEVQTFNIPASAVGAPHQRKRIWIVAHAKRYNEIQQIQRSDGVQDQIQSKCGQEDSASRVFSRTSSIRQTNHRHEDVEDSRRTLRQRPSIGEENENETRKEDANQHQRSSSPSESDVANADSRLSNGTQEEIQTRGDASNISSEKLSNTDSERLEGQRQSSGQFSQKFFTSNNSEGQQGSMDQGWWSVEPNVGRVAHGVPGRIHRLKALGNSIIPKIAEEIGKAIMKAENEN
jgi:DNA (cytosine-5)-methyltransferase 1